jgi:hypothetical protein
MWHLALRLNFVITGGSSVIHSGIDREFAEAVHAGLPGDLVSDTPSEIVESDLLEKLQRAENILNVQ